MNFRPLIITFFVANCSNSSFEMDFKGNSSSSITDYQQGEQEVVETEDNTATFDENDETTQFEDERVAKIEVDALPNGDGITIGNGQNNEDEVEEEISAPIMITGHFLTSCQVFEQVISCSLNPDEMITEDDFDKIQVVDDNGDIIPNEELQFEIVIQNGQNLLQIVYPDAYVVTDVQETNLDIGEAAPAEQQEADIIDNRRCTIEILEMGLTANLNCSEEIPSFQHEFLTSFNAIYVKDTTYSGNPIVDADFTIIKSSDGTSLSFTGLNNVDGSLKLTFVTEAGEEEEFFSYQELRGE